MAKASICAAPECGKPAHPEYCYMHRARLARGGTLEKRKPRKPFSDLLNGMMTFGEWSVIREGKPYERPMVGENPSPHGKMRTALCRCSCGQVRTIPVQTLKAGHSKHCGCMVPAMLTKMKTVHGMSQTAEYRSWSHLKERCSNPNCKDWPDYGGRGIRVCDQWRDSFQAFYDYIGPKPDPSYSIDRIDVNGHYEPGNVRWADPITQANNKRKP